MDRVLVGLLIVQLVATAVFLSRSSGAVPIAPPIDPPELGEILPEVRSLESGGATIGLASILSRSAPNVLFAFSADCVHCDTVAPAWRDWLLNASGVRAVGISDNDRLVAEAYAHDKGCNLPIHILPTAAKTNIERFLLSRTPWLFVISSHGLLVYEGHGADLEGLDAALATLQLR